MKDTQLLIIPVYRCPKQIHRVLSSLAAHRSELADLKRVAIFDNCSPDDTVEVAREVVALNGLGDWISVFRNKKNYGLGGTHKIAFSWALENEFSRVIVMHGDDQAQIEDLPKIIKGLEQGFGAVLGSRFMRGSRRPGYSWVRVAGNVTLNAVFTLVTRKPIYDLGSGLNGFCLSKIAPQVYQNCSNGFTFNTEFLLGILTAKISFIFLPITWQEEDQSSNARNFRVAFGMLKALGAWLVGRAPSNQLLPTPEFDESG